MSGDGSWQPYVGALVGAGLEPDRGFGELQICAPPGTAFTVVRADPRVRLSGRLIREAFGDGPVLPGARLVIHGTDRRLVYVIGRHHEATEDAGDWYEAEWPD